jgi:signal peptidase II
MPVRGGKEKTQGLIRSLFLLLAGWVVLLDQLTKALAVAYLPPETSRPVFPNVFHLTLVENQGIAFGLFQGYEELLFVLITASIAVLILIGLRSDDLRVRIQMAYGLILGGAIGNWIDRLRVGAVIDFLDFRIWPVFNLADTAITVGVGLFLLDLLIRRKHVS